MKWFTGKVMIPVGIASVAIFKLFGADLPWWILIPTMSAAGIALLWLAWMVILNFHNSVEYFDYHPYPGEKRLLAVLRARRTKRAGPVPQDLVNPSRTLDPPQ